jgi:hypothetical protein
MSIVVNFFLSCLSAFLPLTLSHDMHVSMCELRFVEETSTFQVSIKVFIDDLEVAMKKEGLPPLYLGIPKENELAEEQIASYLNKYFTIDIDGKKWQAKFIGKELSEDYLAVWCYLEYSGEINKAQLCTLTNRILLDIYDDQRNIMDIRMNKTHKAYTILDPSHPSWNYTF